MGARELIISGIGPSRLRVGAAREHVEITAEALRVDGSVAIGVVSLLDRNAQHLLMLYLQERLGLK